MLEKKLNVLREELKKRPVRIMIIGLGSVGSYLLDYLMSMGSDRIEICAVGRNREKMESDVNIVRVSSLIRGYDAGSVKIISDVNLEDPSQIEGAIRDFGPDIIVNSSRAYPGLKYGSISWEKLRAYGIWSPLAVHFTKRIMQACRAAASNAIVINTSYSDAVIPWLKSAGMAYPELGSGNINHLIPRIKLATAKLLDTDEPGAIDVTFAVSHFHDVVISKEGHSGGVDMLLDIRFRGEKIDADINKLLSMCSIPMPTDSKRNQMNASSNFEIIKAIIGAVRFRERHKLHCPGAFGEIGGYPVMIDGGGDEIRAGINEEIFSLDDMRKKNRESIRLDGIEDVKNGILTYTDELLDKVSRTFNVRLPGEVSLEESDEVAEFIIREIIEPYRS